MTTFNKLLVLTLISSTKNNFVWFALTYWIYLQTHSVLSTSIMGGLFLLLTSFSGFFFGSIVDHYHKKSVMINSNNITTLMFIVGFVVYNFSSPVNFNNISNPIIWLLSISLLVGVIAGNLWGICMSTLVTLLVPKANRDKADGAIGTVNGISFSLTSVASGLVLGYGGFNLVLVIAIIASVLVILGLTLIQIPETKIVHTDEHHGKVDIKGTIKVIGSIPGMFALIFFTTFNNFLGGVFMSLMDAYGLSLVSVQVWGMLWGVISFGFIAGGLFIAKRGLGKNPVKNLFTINLILWLVCIIFPLQPSIILLAIGMMIYITLVPFVEATEQTIIQRVVPPHRQGRVFGFAQSIEQAASPITSFLIGPIAEFIFIPFMTTGVGVRLIGPWFGVGHGRGIALVFILTGIIGYIVTYIAKHSKSYLLLNRRYQRSGK